MHPSGQLPAYEWDFSDANPPVHAHAARRVYEIDRDMTGRADTDFLEEVFHKLLLNFTWWVNRKDPEGRNAFQGGFLGLDNIGVFDRSRPNLGDGRRLEQADGTAWMGMFCLDMLAIALELSHDPAGLRGDRHQVLRALRGDLARDQRDSTARSACGTRSMASTTTWSASRAGRPSTSRSARSWA